jgi:hypothetical protein
MEIPGKLIRDAENNVLNLAGNSSTAEFNIFGECCESQAHFSGGTALWLKTETEGATTSHPLLRTHQLHVRDEQLIFDTRRLAP